MRLKGIVLATLLVAALTISCGSITFKPMFDMSKWTTDTYPAFVHGSLTDATPPSSAGTGLQEIKFKPMFDMSPGSFSFDSYPAFSGGQGTGVIYGMMTGIMSRSY